MTHQLSLIMPYYINREMLRLQYANARKWPSRVRKQVKIILVDDGSPEDPAHLVPRPYGLPDVEIYRVLADKPWHQHGARNIGAHEASSPWLLLTDMDHMLEPEPALQLLRMITKGHLEPSTCYMLDRIEADTRQPTLGRTGQPKPHPNSFVMTRQLFWQVGGYDERATGVYGTDKLFRARAQSIGTPGHLELPLTRYWRDLVPDASTRTLPRKEGRDAAERQRILAEVQRNPGGRIALAAEYERLV